MIPENQDWVTYVGILAEMMDRPGKLSIRSRAIIAKRLLALQDYLIDVGQVVEHHALNEVTEPVSE